MFIIATPVCIALSANNAVKEFAFSNSERNHRMVIKDDVSGGPFLLVLGLYNGVLVRKPDLQDISYLPWSRVVKISYKQ